MRRYVYFWGATSIALMTLGSLGCGGSPDPASPPTVEQDEHARYADEDQPEEVRGALAGLSPEDRQSAERQRICPVSGQLLGSMGEPIKLEVEDREVWICCAGCEGPLRYDPEQYIAELDP